MDTIVEVKISENRQDLETSIGEMKGPPSNDAKEPEVPKTPVSPMMDKTHDMSIRSEAEMPEKGRIPLGGLFARLTKFDGTAAAEDWIIELEINLRDYKVHNFSEYKYFDRVFCSGPWKWWCARKSYYLCQIQQAEKEESIKSLWTEFKSELVDFFGRDALTPVAKTKLQMLKVRKETDDMLGYVFSKLKLFHVIDPKMPETTKLVYLVEGLPAKMADLYKAEDFASVAAFTKKINAHSWDAKITADTNNNKEKPLQNVKIIKKGVIPPARKENKAPATNGPTDKK